MGTHMPQGITQCYLPVPATRQRWHSRPYLSRSWYSIKRPRRDAKLSWPSRARDADVAEPTVHWCFVYGRPASTCPIESVRLPVDGMRTFISSHTRFLGSLGRCVVARCPLSTARLQRSPMGRVESFRSWSSHLFRGRPGGRRNVRSEVGWVIRLGLRGAEEPIL